MRTITTKAGTRLGKWLDGIAGLILSRWFLVAALMGATAYYAYAAGNTYGPYARAYRAMVAELNTKNAELEKQKAEDERKITAAEAARDAAVEAAANVKTCKATKAQAKAINKVKE